MISFKNTYETVIRNLQNYKILDSEKEFIKHFGDIFPSHTRMKEEIYFESFKQQTFRKKIDKKAISKKLILKLKNLKAKLKDSDSILDQDFAIILESFHLDWFHEKNIIIIDEKRFKLKFWGIEPKYFKKGIQTGADVPGPQPKKNNKKYLFLIPISILTIILLLLMAIPFTLSRFVTNQATEEKIRDLTNTQWRFESEDGTPIYFVTFLENNSYNKISILDGQNKSLDSYRWELKGDSIFIIRDNVYKNIGILTSDSTMTGEIHYKSNPNNRNWTATKEEYNKNDARNHIKGPPFKINEITFFNKENDALITKSISTEPILIYYKIDYDSRDAHDMNLKDIRLDVKIKNNEKNYSCPTCEHQDLILKDHNHIIYIPVQNEKNNLYGPKEKALGLFDENKTHIGYTEGTLRYEFYWEGFPVGKSRGYEFNVSGPIKGSFKYSQYHSIDSNYKIKRNECRDCTISFAENMTWKVLTKNNVEMNRGTYEILGDEIKLNIEGESKYFKFTNNLGQSDDCKGYLYNSYNKKRKTILIEDY